MTEHQRPKQPVIDSIAQKHSLRCNFLDAMNFRQPTRMPRYLEFTPAKLREFSQKTGSDCPEDYFKQAHRFVGIHNAFKDSAELPAGTGDPDMDLLGVDTQAGSLYHYVKVLHPMADFHSPEQVRNYGFPEYDPMLESTKLSEVVGDVHGRGMAAVGDARLIFTLACYLRGMEQLLCDLYENQELVETLLDRLTELSVFKARACARCGVDAIFVYEDVATQRGLLMSPEMWRTRLKPRMARVIQAAREIRPGLPVLYDSDGDISDIIDDLLEVGVNAISPMQPECMDLDAIYRRHQGRLVFWGTIGVQTTMPYGSPADVRRAVRYSIDTYGRNGGLVIGPAHVISPDIPWENIMAFFEAVEEFGP